MVIKTNVDIADFIKTNLYVQNCMLIQKNWSIFALRQYLLYIGLKSEVMTFSSFSLLAETTHIIIHGKLTKDKAKLFMSEYNYRIIDI